MPHLNSYSRTIRGFGSRAVSISYQSPDGATQRHETAFFDLKRLKMPTIPDAHKRTITDYVLQAITTLNSTAAQDAIVKEASQPSSDPSLLRMALRKESLGGIRKRVEEYSKIAE